jgi:TonB family protein
MSSVQISPSLPSPLTPGHAFLLAGGGVAAIVITVFLVSSGVRSTHVSAAGPASTLDLRVRVESERLVLSWNPEAAVARTADQAVLSILDGGRAEDVELDLAFFRGGSVVYAPLGRDVTFRLWVKDSRQPAEAAESVRVLVGMPEEAPPALVPEAAVEVPARRTFEPPQERTQPATHTAAIPEPPALPAQAQPEPAVPQPRAAVSLPAAPAAEVRPQPQPQPAPATPNAPRGPVRLDALRIVHRVAPVYPPLARQTRVSGTVRVEVRVGPDGRVRQAHAVQGPSLLLWVAENAVRQWVFEAPGAPEAVLTVEVNFTP